MIQLGQLLNTVWDGEIVVSVRTEEIGFSKFLVGLRPYGHNEPDGPVREISLGELIDTKVPDFLLYIGSPEELDLHRLSPLDPRARFLDAATKGRL